jgi:hypothetical protein
MNDLRGRTRRAAAVWVLIGLVALPVSAAKQPYGGATPQELVERMQAAAEAGDFGEIMACMAPEDRKAMGGIMVSMGVMMVGFSQMAVDMGGAMADGLGEAFAGEEGMDPEEKARMEAEMAEARAEADAMMARLREVLEPHGLAGMLDEGFEPGSAEDQALEEALENADMIALTEDMMGLLAEMDDGEGGEDGEDGGMMGGDPAEEAAPDWASQEVTDFRIDGDTATAQAGDETLEMIRVDGRWYFAPEMEMEDGMMDGMEPPAEGEPMPEEEAEEPEGW